MKNTKKLYQFDNFLVHNPNQSGSYMVDVKNNQESGNAIDGVFDNNFYIQKSPSVNFEFSLDCNEEYGADDLDFMLHELRDQPHNSYSSQSKMKKVFWVTNCHDLVRLRPRIFWNYAYCTNLKINYSDSNVSEENTIAGNLNLKKPFFFECDRDVGLLDSVLLANSNMYRYDTSAAYDDTATYDSSANIYINPNATSLSDNQLKAILDCCGSEKKLIKYTDFFNLAGARIKESNTSLMQRRDDKTLVLALALQNQVISTDRSKIALGGSFPSTWTGGKLDLNTSRKSEVMVIEIDGNTTKDYWIKIKNEENGSFLKFTWLASVNAGVTTKVQIYPHLNKVWTNDQLANPLTDYSLEVSNQFGTLYFDSLYTNPSIPAKLGNQDSQAVSITQSSSNPNNTILIQTLKTFY